MTDGSGGAVTSTALRDLLEGAARGRFPEPDWGLTVVPRPDRLAGAVIGFTAHHVVAAEVDRVELEEALGSGDVSEPMKPAFLAWLAGRLGARAGHVDATLARMGGGGTGPDAGWLADVPDPPDNERVQRSQRIRTAVRHYGPPGVRAIVLLGEGLAGRLELAMEIDDEAGRNQGLGTRLVRAAVDLVPADTAVFTSVAPGNARSLRCLLAAGFRPIGAECLLTSG